jgi:hypothetical protein
MIGEMGFRRPQQLSALDPRERQRVALVGLVVLAMRLGLWLVPYRVLRRMVEVSPRRPRPNPDAPPPAWISRYIVSISRFIPQATCLTQALAAHYLLRREGFDPQLELGVAREGGAFKAHGWVVCRGLVIVGDFTGTPLAYQSLSSIAPASATPPTAPKDHISPAAAAAGPGNT